MRKIILSISCLLASFLSFSQVGSPDPGFANGTGKVVNYTTTNSNDKANAIAIQGDGKIVIAGVNFIVMRYKADGSLDNTFGTLGKVSTIPPPARTSLFYYNLASVTGVAIQTDGKIILAGIAEATYIPTFTRINVFIIYRLNSNGTIDNTFGGNNTGYIIKDMYATDNQPTCIALQSNGQILVGGFTQLNSSSTYYVYAVLRLNANGTVDNNFGGFNQSVYLGGNSYALPGVALINISNTYGYTNDRAYGIAVAAYQKILVAGNTGLTRLQTNGQVDGSFNGGLYNNGGTVQNGSGVAFHSCALQSDGKIIVSVYMSNGSFYGTTVRRYNTNGTADNTFSGALVNSLGNSSYTPTSMVLQSDGKIVVTASIDAGNVDFKIIRFNTNGTLDNNFSTGGIATLHFGPPGNTTASGSNAVAFNNGRIYVAGYTNYNPTSYYYYNSNTYYA